VRCSRNPAQRQLYRYDEGFQKAPALERLVRAAAGARARDSSARC